MQSSRNTPLRDGEAFRILHFEDSENDAILVREVLEEAGIACDIVRASTKDQFTRAMDEGPWDLIMSDYSIPSFSGQQAFKLARTKLPETPFVFVSGTIGEERAVEALVNGAVDYVLKSNLKRIVPVINRLIAERKLRKEKEQSETRLRWIEEQLRQAQKVEAIGRLASGVAHDFNNILTAILGYCDFLLRGMDPKDERFADLKEIDEAAKRAANLTRQLLAFSRRQPTSPQFIVVNTIVTAMEKMLKRIIGEDISFVAKTAPDLWTIRADPSQIEQIILNLVVNARDAMEGGGQITVETENVQLKEPRVARGGTVPAGSYVRLSIQDTGIGMTDEVLEHLFEPFFTTKEKDRGTGLGLSTVFGIVKQHEGWLIVESAPGKGTRFEVYFQKAKQLEKEEPAPKSPAKLAGTETVLLIEDEAPVRQLFSRILGQAGYHVIEAGDGVQGWDLYRANGKDIKLVIVDVVLPKLSGQRLLDQLADKRADLPIICVSGHTQETAVNLAALGPRVTFLQKPFSPDALLASVRGALEKKAR